MSQSSDRELFITRVLKAPRELVWEAWTDPKHIIHWWGPDGFTNTIHAMEVKPGGVFHLTMHGPDGTDFPNKIVYREVVKPSLLVWTHGSGIKDDPREFETTVTFEEKQGKTEITMRMVFKTKEARDLVVEKYGALEGNRQTIDKLELYLQQLIQHT
jgi:uncharacterized protein YndB with AHSA1/START domain